MLVSSWVARFGHRTQTVDPRSGLHGDEQDLGRYPALLETQFIVDFQEWGGGCSGGGGGEGGGDGGGGGGADRVSSLGL